MSARVAALTYVRVLVSDRFVFSMVHIVTNNLLESVTSGTLVPSFIQRFVSVSLKGREVAENVFAGWALDESESFGDVIRSYYGISGWNESY
jgi:hypothetical protein